VHPAGIALDADVVDGGCEWIAQSTIRLCGAIGRADDESVVGGPKVRHKIAAPLRRGVLLAALALWAERPAAEYALGHALPSCLMSDDHEREPMQHVPTADGEGLNIPVPSRQDFLGVVRKVAGLHKRPAETDQPPEQSESD